MFAYSYMTNDEKITANANYGSGRDVFVVSRRMPPVEGLKGHLKSLKCGLNDDGSRISIR